MRCNNIYKLFFALSLFCLVFAASDADAQQKNDEFERYAKKINDRFNAVKSSYNARYEAYRSGINKQFATYLEREWKKIVLLNPELVPDKPEPEFDKPSGDDRLLPNREPSVVPVDVAPPKPVNPIKAKPVVPIRLLPDNSRIVVVPDDVIEEPVEPTIEPEHTVSFQYLSNKIQIRFPDESGGRIHLGNLNRHNLSGAWNELAKEKYNSMLVDCICIRESLQLCDWAFYQLLLEFTKAVYGSEESSEAVLTQAYILSQMGYKLRLVDCSGKLHMIIAYRDQIYAVPYYTIGGEKFYAFTLPSSSSVHFCDFEFPGEKASTATVGKLPVVPVDETPKKTYKSKRYQNVSVNVGVNRNLLAFYDNYPSCRWDFKAQASLSKEIKDQLYPILRKEIQGKSEEESANILINFVQTAFEYMTDDKQFGREKAFFGDELFYYPYSDCEDRSVLYAILVKDLLKLDVVLLEYPTHLATAVKFNEDIRGDYFLIEGKKYLVCDPTYIGATIGQSMNSMRNVEATIIKVN